MTHETNTSRRALLGGALGACAWLATGCDRGSRVTALPTPGETDFGGLSMGTTYTVKIASRQLPPAMLAEAQRAVADALSGVVSNMSHYDEDSELSRLNRQPLGQAWDASPALLQVLKVAQQVHGDSAGAFDVSLGEAVQAWGFGPHPPARRIPEADRLRALQRPRGDAALALDPGAGTVTRRAPVSLDLSGIAKGFGVDQAARALARLQLTNYMVEVGGEIRTSGRNAQGQPWRLAIERPDALPQRALRVLPLQDRALATSGDYRNYFVHEGRRYSHEIDPASARPVRHSLASVSVVADDCLHADAWSTALFVLGPDEGFDTAHRLGLAAYFVRRESGGRFVEQPTPAFAALGGYSVA